MSDAAIEGRTNEELYGFLLSLGTDEVAHTGGDFLHHLQAVQRVLEEWGAEPVVSRAGLFHSIYGTELFQDFSLPLAERDQMRELIGERSELTAYCNCVMDRATLDATVVRALAGEGDLEIRDREGGSIALTREQLVDLAQVHLFDWLEQAERSELGWDHRRQGYRNLAELIGPSAVVAYDAVFALEGSSTPS